MRQRWTINGRFLSQQSTGVQRYARQIVTGMDRLLGEGGALPESVALDLVVPPGADSLDLRHIRVRTVGRFGGHAWEQFELPMHVRGGLLSLGNTGPVSIAHQIVCIHDLNPRICPDSYTVPFRVSYRLLHSILGRRARRITTVSAYSARQIAQFGIATAGRIAVVPNGHEHVHAWEPRLSPIVERNSGSDTIVLLGSTARHKNVGIILQMAERLAQEGLRIAIVGDRNPAVFADRSHPTDAPNITWLGRLDDGELAALLRRSLCLAFPSLTEGFGLPPLEAMALGCAVVVSDRASLPEICGDAALYAAPTRAEEWHAQFRLLRDRPDLRTALVRRGLSRVEAFSWRRSADLYLRLLAQTSDPRALAVPSQRPSLAPVR